MLGEFFRKYGWQYIPGILFLVLSSILQTQSPRLLGQIIDALSVQQIDRNLVYRLTLFTILVAVGVFITRYIWRYLINGNGRNLEALARQRLFTHFQEMGVHFYSYRKTGDLMAYAINDINAIRQTFGPAIAMLVNGISTTAISISNMSAGVNPRLAVFALAPVPIIVLVMFFMGREVRTRFRRVQEVFASVSDRVQENISGLRVIKAYVQEDAEVQRFEELNQASRDSNMGMVKVSASMAPLVDLLFGISFTISLIYGGSLVRQGTISVGDFVAFNGYLTLIIMPVRSIARIINVLSRGMASLKRYNALMEVPPMITDGNGFVPPKVNHADVLVDHLSFQYPQDSRMALQDISFHLKPGKTLGILGRTGSGKTTLVNLLVRLFNVPDGSIRIGGVDINQFTLEQLRRPIGYVPQDNFLFSASIEENVRFFSNEYSQEDVEEATRQAVIHDNIADFPEGYDTQVGERGMSLSGGQKQRICIARALITKPALLILDDSLSAVDAQTEATILENIQRQTKGGGSAILIAHRISALAGCDEIIVLDSGRITERGTHQQLMGMGGLYASIANDQMLSEEETEGGGAI